MLIINKLHFKIMGKFNLRTVRGYDFFEASSTMQKAIRRNDVKTAGYFALELWQSKYDKYVWKRLYTISAEDCAGIITQEIQALHNGYQLVNAGAKSPKGRIFISKAVILLCSSYKSRDADHLQNIVYDQSYGINENEIEKYFEEVRNEPYLPIPDYAYDVHTREGKKMGKTKSEFFVEEHKALQPKLVGLFDDLHDKYQK